MMKYLKSDQINSEQIVPSFFMQMMFSDTTQEMGGMLLVAGLIIFSIGLSSQSLPLIIAGVVATVIGPAFLSCRFFFTSQTENLLPDSSSLSNKGRTASF